jgi:predicted HicB family RNase H-like nuclease
MVRVLPEVHRNLVLYAAEEGVSLNRYISAKLSSGDTIT